eukprot:scaffold309859_cov44-Tisochrysis_lutea.AAC.2
MLSLLSLESCDATSPRRASPATTSAAQTYRPTKIPGTAARCDPVTAIYRAHHQLSCCVGRSLKESSSLGCCHT